MLLVQQGSKCPRDADIKSDRDRGSNNEGRAEGVVITD